MNDDFYSASGRRRYYGDLTIQRDIAVGDTTVTGITVKNTSYSIFIQRILANITTDAARTLKVRDSASTPIMLMDLPSSPGVGQFEIDFGADGKQLTEGKNLDIVLSGAGLVGSLVIEAYQKPTAASRTVANA